MSIPAATALWFLPFALPIAIWVAWSDMKFMKIPNTAVIALGLGFVVIGPIALPFDSFLWRIAQGAAMLGIGFLAYSVRALGAGDAKFLAVMAPMLDPGDTSRMTILAALVLLAAFATHRLARNIPAITRRFPDWESWHRKDFPMGLGLGAFLILYLVSGAVYGSVPIR